jgi:hypothetical protein
MQGGFGGGGHVVTTVQHAAWVEGGCFAYGTRSPPFRTR